MLNLQTLISSFDDKPTLLRWLKKVEKALADASLESAEITSVDATHVKIKFIFADGTYVESESLTLPRGEAGAPGAPGQQGPAGAPGDTPYIKNGNWWVGNTDTEIQAQGPKGDDGTTFRILGEVTRVIDLPSSAEPGDAYFVGAQAPRDVYAFDGITDTWKNQGKLQGPTGPSGPAGAPGDTPYIKNGNWWVGNTDTGIQAQGPQGQQGPAGQDAEITIESLLALIEGSDFISVDVNEAETKIVIELDQTKVDSEVTEDSENLVTSGAVFEAIAGLLPATKQAVANVGGLVTPTQAPSAVELVGIDSTGAQVRIQIDTESLELVGNTSPYTLKAKSQSPSIFNNVVLNNGKDSYYGGGNLSYRKNNGNIINVPENTKVTLNDVTKLEIEWNTIDIGGISIQYQGEDRESIEVEKNTLTDVTELLRDNCEIMIENFD